MTRDPGDVGEQCSNTWQPLDSKSDPVQVVVVMMMVVVVLMKLTRNHSDGEGIGYAAECLPNV